MSILLLAAATSAILSPGPVPVAATPQSPERYEFWLYPPGIAPGGRQRWGVITAPSLAEARSDLENRQASQRLWWTWVGAKNDSTDDPFSYDNFMGPIEVKKSPFMVSAGITTANVWIVSLEEVMVRRRATAELAQLRSNLEKAKTELETLFPIDSNARAAADLRGRSLYMAGPLVSTMAKVREAEATLQAAQGYTLADLAYELDQVEQQLRLLIPTVSTYESVPTPPITKFVDPTNPIDPRGGSPDKGTPSEKPAQQGGATILVPPGGAKTEETTDQGPKVLVPGGLGSPTTGAPTTVPSTTKLVIAELNRLLGSPFPGRNGDDTLFAYQFDREGITIRARNHTDNGFQPAPPERVAFAAIGDPEQLFLYKGDRQSVAYGDSDTTKFKFRPLVTLPVNTSEETAKEILGLMRHLVAPDSVPAVLPASLTEAAKPKAPTEQEANNRMDTALANVFAPHRIDAKELIPSVLPDWYRDHLVARSTYDAKALAGYYSENLAPGAQTLDEQNRPATLEAISNTITGSEFRGGDIERALWTVSSYEERNGSFKVTLQASYVGASANSAADRAVHGVKLTESWAVTSGGAPVLNQIRILRPGTVLRPTPPSPQQFADRHFEEASKMLADGRPQAAMAEFESALRLHPESPQYWSQFAVAQYQLGQNQDALASYRLARDLDPQNPIIIANYSTVLRSIGDYATAVVAAKQGAEIAPTNVWAREAYALALFETKDFAGAAEQYAEAVKIAPTDARLRANYASALLRADRKEEAMTEAKAAYDAGFRNHWVFQELKIGL